MRWSPKPPLKPKPLAPGAIIGVVAPASPFPREEFDQGLAILHAMGYATRLAEGLFERQGYLAGSDCMRAEQVHAMFRDDRVDAVMCARGGFGSLRILSLLDFALLASHPKPFIGFSDISALHYALFAAAGLVTFHGPMVCTLSRSDALTHTFLQQMLGSHPPCALPGNYRALRPGQSQGVLLGGNLATLCHLIGTPFACNFGGSILFIEEAGEAPYRMERMLVQMKMAGCFDRLAGVVLGSFEECGEPAQIERLACQLFEGVPILAGVGAGHGGRNLTLPLGIRAALDADRGELRFLERPSA